MKITNVYSRKVTTKFGEKDVWDVEVDGETFSYGFKKPPFNAGDEVNFAFTEDKYGKKIDVTSVRVLSAGSGGGKGSVIPSPVAPSKPSYGPTPKPFPIPPLHGDRAIVRQNSLTNARELFCSCVLAVPEVPLEDFEKHAATIITIARIFEAYSAGDSDMKEALGESK